MSGFTPNAVPLSQAQDFGSVWMDEYMGVKGAQDRTNETANLFLKLWQPGARSYDFTHDELRKMHRYDSLDYAEAQSFVFREHLLEHASPSLAVRWAMYGVIGLIIGAVGFCIFTSIETIGHWRMHVIEETMHNQGKGVAFVSVVSLTLVLASGIVCVVVPAAAGSGVPEVMGFLNGVMFPRVFNFRTLVAKSVSTILSVSGGLPVGAEGPMIHIGSLIAAGVSSGRSRTFRCSSTTLDHFRNSKDTRDFVTAGAAAGLTVVFRAPIGGLLFVMEEVASTFPVSLAWMVFFCCLSSIFLVNNLNTYMDTWLEIKPQTLSTGGISNEAVILFGVVQNVPLNVFSVFPAAIIGAIGGLLAVIFTTINLNVIKFRNKYIAPHMYRRVLEPCVLGVIFTSAVFFIASSWGCRDVGKFKHNEAMSVELKLFHSGCSDGKHNSFASLSISSVYDAVRALFNAPQDTFDIVSLVVYFFLYFFFAAVTAGCSISHGILIPTVIIGALYGRITGHLISSFMNTHYPDVQWASVGVFAVVGCAGFFAGLSRLTFSLTIIMIEMTADLSHLLVVMVSIWAAKATAESFTASLYEGILRAKCVPFLENELHDHKLALHAVRTIMSSPVISLRSVEKINHVVSTLLQYHHNGFVVVTSEGHYRGIIMRDQLEELLWFIVMTCEKGDDGTVTNTRSPPNYEELREVRELIFWNRYTSATRHPLIQSIMSMLVDLNPYVDTSGVAVQESMSIPRTYQIFRALSLRHLVVTNMKNEPVGMITRKDLVHNTIDAKLRASQVIVRDFSCSNEGLLQNPAAGMDGDSGGLLPRESTLDPTSGIQPYARNESRLTARSDDLAVRAGGGGGDLAYLEPAMSPGNACSVQSRSRERLTSTIYSPTLVVTPRSRSQQNLH